MLDVSERIWNLTRSISAREIEGYGRCWDFPARALFNRTDALPDPTRVILSLKEKPRTAAGLVLHGPGLGYKRAALRGTPCFGVGLRR
jgi:hypothetical protein